MDRLVLFLGAESIQECTQKLPGDDQWQCLQPTFFYKHLFTPVFFLNSLHDAWYSKNAMGVNCPFSTCSQSDINILDQHRSSLLSRASSILQSLQDGIYLTSCPVHTMTMNKRFSSQLSEGGISPQNALMKWYFHQVPNYTFVENIDFRKATAVCKLDSWSDEQVLLATKFVDNVPVCVSIRLLYTCISALIVVWKGLWKFQNCDNSEDPIDSQPSVQLFITLIDFKFTCIFFVLNLIFITILPTLSLYYYNILVSANLNFF